MKVLRFGCIIEEGSVAESMGENGVVVVILIVIPGLILVALLSDWKSRSQDHIFRSPYVSLVACDSVR